MRCLGVKLCAICACLACHAFLIRHRSTSLVLLLAGLAGKLTEHCFIDHGRLQLWIELPSSKLTISYILQELEMHWGCFASSITVHCNTSGTLPSTQKASQSPTSVLASNLNIMATLVSAIEHLLAHM